MNMEIYNPPFVPFSFLGYLHIPRKLKMNLVTFDGIICFFL